MRKLQKTMATAMLVSLISSNLLCVMGANADEYTVVPQYQQYESTSQVQPQAQKTYTEMPTYQPIQEASNNTLKGQVSSIPGGTSFILSTTQSIHSETAKVGEMFVAKIDQPVMLNGVQVIPAGSEAIGQITYLKPAGRLGKHASMDIRFTSVKLPNGQTLPIMGKIETVDKSGLIKGGSLKNQLASSVSTLALGTAGGTLAGVGVGSMMGAAGGGAVLGVTTGGLAALAYMFGRKGKSVVIPNGSRMIVTLEHPVTVGN